jgi:CRP/FNR family cyclic AMP-dependent transcriptional regulator
MVNYLWDNLFQKDQREEEIDAVLRDNFIFRILNKIELLFVKDLFHVRTYRPGEAIFTQGEVGVGMYIVVKGTVNITVENLRATEESQRLQFITRLAKGDFFGELALVEQAGRYTASATAADAVTLIGFFKPDLQELTDRNPRISNKVILRLAEVLGRRLRETSDRFTEVKKELKELSEKNAKS